MLGHNFSFLLDSRKTFLFSMHIKYMCWRRSSANYLALRMLSKTSLAILFSSLAPSGEITLANNLDSPSGLSTKLACFLSLYLMRMPILSSSLSPSLMTFPAACAWCSFADP